MAQTSGRNILTESDNQIPRRLTGDRTSAAASSEMQQFIKLFSDKEGQKAKGIRMSQSSAMLQLVLDDQVLRSHSLYQYCECNVYALDQNSFFTNIEQQCQST